MAISNAASSSSATTMDSSGTAVPSRVAQSRVVTVCGGNMRSVGLGVMRLRQ
jgi:hypothetical protein